MPEAPGNETTRAHSQEQIAIKKKLLGATKPLGTRLGGARAALERAIKRQATAEESIALALAAQTAAVDEVRQLRADVKALEDQIASANAGPPTSENPMPSLDVFQQLESLLQEAVADLSKAERIGPDAVQEAGS